MEETKPYGWMNEEDAYGCLAGVMLGPLHEVLVERWGDTHVLCQRDDEDRRYGTDLTAVLSVMQWNSPEYPEWDEVVLVARATTDDVVMHDLGDSDHRVFCLVRKDVAKSFLEYHRDKD